MDSNFNNPQGGSDQNSFNPSSYAQNSYQQTGANPSYGQVQPNYAQNPVGQAQYQQQGYPQGAADQNFAQPQYQQTGYPQGGYMQVTPQEKVKVKRTFNLGHFLVMGGSILTAVSVFLTYASASALGMSESTSLFDSDDGMIFLVTGIVVAVLGLLRLNTLNIITTFFLMFLSIYENAMNKDNFDMYSGFVDKGVGYYLLVVGAVVAFVGAIIGMILRIKQKRDAQNRGY